MAAERDSLETSEDAVLGGRLRLRQPLAGHRVGHDAILLAAATGGRAGEQAVDLGAGVGAAGLALAARVAGLKVTLVEIDDDACAARRRQCAQSIGIGRARARARLRRRGRRRACRRRDLRAGSADRVLMNPPFHDARRHNVSPDARRASGPCRRARPAAALDRRGRWLLKPGGVLTLIWRADEAATTCWRRSRRIRRASRCCRSSRARARRRSACWCARVKGGRGAPSYSIRAGAQRRARTSRPPPRRPCCAAGKR